MMGMLHFADGKQEMVKVWRIEIGERKELDFCSLLHPLRSLE